MACNLLRKKKKKKSCHLDIYIFISIIKLLNAFYVTLGKVLVFEKVLYQ